jgi:hypothetical protein
MRDQSGTKPFAGARVRRHIVRGSLSLPVVAACCMIGPPTAQAVFARPSLCRTTTSAQARGLSVDSEDHLWVAEDASEVTTTGSGPSNLYEFEPAYATCGARTSPQPLGISGRDRPTHLAIERSTGRFYVSGPRRSSGEGGVEVFDTSGLPVSAWTNEHVFISGDATTGVPVAIDNSTEIQNPESGCGTPPLLAVGECFVFVAHSETDPAPPAGDGLRSGVERLTPSGEPAPFSGSAPYLSGNEITGTSTSSFASESAGLRGLAVDQSGDIYVINSSLQAPQEVDEYRPSGLFVRAFTGAETPGLGNSGAGTFGGFLDDVVVDPVSGHLLVSLSNTSAQPEGAIDEFDAETGRFLNQITEASGSHLQSAHDLASDSAGDVSVLDELSHSIDVYGPGHFLPRVVAEPTASRTSTSALARGVVTPEAQEGFGLGACQFEYTTRESFLHEGFSSATSVECEPAASQITSNSSPQPVQAPLSPLTPGDTYYYRLSAATDGPLGGSAVSSPLTITAPAAPSIIPSSVLASYESSTSVDLEAKIAPRGAETTYHFDYVSDADYRPSAGDPYELGASAPVPPASIGSGGPTGSEAEAVLQHVAGLDPSTTYDFRVVAESLVEGAPAVTASEDHQFATLAKPSFTLPDNRAYELVTPARKLGGSDMFAKTEDNGEFFNDDVGFPSESGTGFLLETLAAFGSFPSAGKSAYVFARTGSGWSATSLATPALGAQGISDTVADPVDFSTVAFNDVLGSEVSEAGARPASMIGSPGGPYLTLREDPAHLQSEGGSGLKETFVVAGSLGLRDVVLESGFNDVCPGAKGIKHGRALCEWTAGSEPTSGESSPPLSLLNVDSHGALLNACGATLGSGGQSGGAHNAVSRDGITSIFTVPDPAARGAGPGCWNGSTEHAPQLYRRSGESTVEISAPEAGVSDPTCSVGEPACHPAIYVGAAEDASKVFFVSESWLTADHPNTHGRELYEYDAATGHLTRVSAGEAGSASVDEGAGVSWVPAVSGDGDVVYFTAFAKLTSSAPPLSEPELVHVYRYDTSTHAVGYVATVNTYDSPAKSLACSNAFGTTDGACSVANWYTTPSGGALLFGTSRDLTGYSTLGPCKELPLNGGNANGHCDELYRYTAADGQLVCVSCNPSGAPPTSNAEFARSARGTPAADVVHAISADGSYAFFDTGDALVAGDNNGSLDVYEWHDGHLALLSSGEDPAPSFFLGSSPYVTPEGAMVEGANVFIGTHARLVPQDTDSSGDIYDARICTSAVPCIKPPPSASAQCEGDACQSPSSLAAPLSPGSALFSGAGNVPAEVKLPVRPSPHPSPLAKALARCRHLYHRHTAVAKHRRASCERQARRRFARRPVVKRPSSRKGTR